jgi:hypothetical protein
MEKYFGRQTFDDGLSMLGINFGVNLILSGYDTINTNVWFGSAIIGLGTIAMGIGVRRLDVLSDPSRLYGLRRWPNKIEIN